MEYSAAINYLRQADPILGQLIDEMGNVEIFFNSPKSNLLSAITWAIISQLISTKAANTIYQKLLAVYGNEFELEAKVILSIPDEDLQKLGISRYKVRYIKNFAQEILSDFPSLSQLAMMTDAEIIQTLTRIKGIGQWTAQMLLIFHLQRLDVLPVDDLGIRRAIQKHYQLDSLPDKKQVVAISQKWQPYRTIASWYLWRSLSDNILAIRL